MEELDDVLKHYGVKGMRWGVSRNRNKPGGADGIKEKKKSSKGKSKNPIEAIKSRNREMNASISRKANKYHEKNKHKKSYQRQHKKEMRKLGPNVKNASEKAAMKIKSEEVRRKSRTAAAALPIVMKATNAAANKVRDVAPEAKRRGKNVVEFAKGSNIRYVDSSKFDDIIDM